MARKTLTVDNLTRQDAQRFGDEAIRDLLDALAVDELIGLLGEPQSVTEYDRAAGWTEGDGRPTLANDDPAVMQSVGRCAASRVRQTFPAPLPLLQVVHPSTCDWCDYPKAELLKACAWAVWQSRHVLTDLLVWQNDEGARYVRAGGLSGYQNPRHRDFWALPPKERERRIDAASGRLVTA